MDGQVRIGEIKNLRSPLWVRAGLAVLLGAVALFVVTGVVFLTLSVNGFCFAQKRFLSDREYYDSVVREIIRQSGRSIVTYRERSVHFRPVVLDSSGSVDEFHQTNPDCCKVVPHNVGDSQPYAHWHQRLFGNAARTIAVNHTLNYTDGNGRRGNRVVTDYFVVTNCGRARSSSH